MSYLGRKKPQESNQKHQRHQQAVGRTPDWGGEDGAHVELTRLPPETIRRKAETPGDAWGLSKQRQRGFDLFDAPVYSSDASELIWGVRNFDGRIVARAVGNVQEWNTECGKSQRSSCTFSLSWQDLIQMFCVNDRGNPFFSFSGKNLLLWHLLVCFGFFAAAAAAAG